jgi:O-antigen chain-terminating methyltransferase
MTDQFYRAFEEVYRGDRALIKRRTQVYIPLLNALTHMSPAPRALDLGCGRGEWLEVLREQGIAAVGVDQDPDMLAPAKDAGLDTTLGEAISCLAQQPDNSLLLVSAFHLVEHLPFADLKNLVALALQKLAPGGLLIMETPNPENMVVGSSEFYLDPTHQRPIPPKLLAFVPRYFGFARTKIVRLQESSDLHGPDDVTLKQVLDGVSPDYAVVAQKAADSGILEPADGFFNREYGISFEALVTSYDSQTRQRKDLEKTILRQTEARALAAEKLAAQFQEEAARLHNEAGQSKAELAAIYNSLSWRITSPLRTLKSLLQRRGPAAASLPGSEPDQADMPPMPSTAGRVYTDLQDAVNRTDREKD